MGGDGGNADACAPGLESEHEMDGIRLGRVVHDLRVRCIRSFQTSLLPLCFNYASPLSLAHQVAGDFSLWRAGPRLRMPKAAIPAPTSPAAAAATAVAAAAAAKAGSKHSTASAPVPAPAPVPAVPTLSVHSFYAGLRDRLGDTSLGQAAALPTPAIGYYTYQVGPCH